MIAAAYLQRRVLDEIHSARAQVIGEKRPCQQYKELNLMCPPGRPLVAAYVSEDFSPGRMYRSFIYDAGKKVEAGVILPEMLFSDAHGYKDLLCAVCFHLAARLFVKSSKTESI